MSRTKFAAAKELIEENTLKEVEIIISTHGRKTIPDRFYQLSNNQNLYNYRKRNPITENENEDSEDEIMINEINKISNNRISSETSYITPLNNFDKFSFQNVLFSEQLAAHPKHNVEDQLQANKTKKINNQKLLNRNSENEENQNKLRNPPKLKEPITPTVHNNLKTVKIEPVVTEKNNLKNKRVGLSHNIVDREDIILEYTDKYSDLSKVLDQKKESIKKINSLMNFYEELYSKTEELKIKIPILIEKSLIDYFERLKNYQKILSFENPILDNEIEQNFEKLKIIKENFSLN
jgi:hypothetical protein